MAPEAVIVSAARSPIGRATKGSLRELRPDDLAVLMVQAALAKVPEVSDIDDLVLGTAQPAAEGGKNLGRAVAVLAGHDKVPGVTVNRFCASSLQTTRMALHAIKAGEGDVFVSVGVESSSHGFPADPPGVRNPILDEASARTTAWVDDGGRDPWADPRTRGELPDLFMPMGVTAEVVSRRIGMSRAEQDEFALRSHALAVQRADEGFWAREITPVSLPDGAVIASDDGPRRGTSLEALAELKPAFVPDGTVTAGNSCPLNDGAAALVIMSDQKAKDLGLVPLARIVSTAVSALSPEIMGLGPVEAIPAALRRAGLTIGDIDLFEINEAFAVQCLGSARALGIPIDKLNVNGGAIALGHPFGMTGARIAATILNSLQWHDKQFAVESMCVGGGQGVAMVLERLS
ncbi:acetyl-CoA C-acetyltransferase [Microbacterium sp. BWT-B31]|uniref:acetyl-CoA C-acetyltransferase n=1 Tax=Microbacterium sp. BWT-B31 TaxID=3232072 RepID=UPI003527A19A